MSLSPLAVLGLSAALAVPPAHGRRQPLAGREARAAAAGAHRHRQARRAGRHRRRAKPAKNQQLQQGALAVMRASTKGFSIMKGRQVDETRKLLVSGGFRSRDAIVVFTFFKLVTPLVFLAGAALYVYGMHPARQGADGRTPRWWSARRSSAASCRTCS